MRNRTHLVPAGAGEEAAVFWGPALAAQRAHVVVHFAQPARGWGREEACFESSPVCPYAGKLGTSAQADATRRAPEGMQGRVRVDGVRARAKIQKQARSKICKLYIKFDSRNCESNG